MTVTLESMRTVFTESLLIGLSLGLFVWFFAWGMNRVYLKFKDIIS